MLQPAQRYIEGSQSSYFFIHHLNQVIMYKGIVIAVGCMFALCIILLFTSIQTLNKVDERIERVNRMSVEYQIVVIDSVISVYDNNRFIGEVQLEGELESLINNDNQ